MNTSPPTSRKTTLGIIAVAMAVPLCGWADEFRTKDKPDSPRSIAIHSEESDEGWPGGVAAADSRRSQQTDLREYWIVLAMVATGLVLYPKLKTGVYELLSDLASLVAWSQISTNRPDAEATSFAAPNTVFVSYSHQDGEMVMAYIGEIKSAGVRVWYDKHIQPSRQWPDAICEAIESCSVVVVFLTKNSIKSEMVQDELFFAIENGKRILPVELEPVELSKGMKLRLGKYQRVRLHEFAAGERHDVLVSALREAMPTDHDFVLPQMEFQRR